MWHFCGLVKCCILCGPCNMLPNVVKVNIRYAVATITMAFTVVSLILKHLLWLPEIYFCGLFKYVFDF